MINDFYNIYGIHLNNKTCIRVEIAVCRFILGFVVK